MRFILYLRLCAFALLALGLFSLSSAFAAQTAAADIAIVFVARAHLATQDDIFRDEKGPAGQFGSGLPKFAPGSKLMLRHANGALTTLVDGANPSASTGNLIDVQAPDVSFDATRIIFAGATTIDAESPQYGWRLYEIGVNGSGFRKIPIPDRAFTSVPNNNKNGYDYGNHATYAWWNDLFPAYLADGRIVFASSRYPSRSEYDGRAAYNLYLVNADGSDLHRITTERGGLLHPTPLPDGRILFARWWNNFNQPASKAVFNRIDNRAVNRTLKDGTVIYANPDETFNPPTGKLPNGYAIRDAPNTWHLHVVNPDGSAFQRFAFTPYAEWARTEDSGLDTYTAAQPALVFNGGKMYIAFTSQQDTTMVHSTQKTGIRVALPGVEMLYANIPDAIAGLTYEKAWAQDDSSPPYAIHPAGMPDGTILFSYAQTADNTLPTRASYTDPTTQRVFDLQGSKLQYKLFTMNIDGSAKTQVAADIGAADALDAKALAPRSGWAAMPDQFTTQSSDDPQQWNVPSDTLPKPYGWSQKTVGTMQMATIHNPNVYANAPLALPFINNSPPPGSVALAEVWLLANQFTGAYCYGDWPDSCDGFKQDIQQRGIKFTSVPVSPRGEFTAQIPADVPAFVVLRDAAGRVVSKWRRGYITIAQGNAYARPGQTVTCIGCHFGHVSGSITNPTEASVGWTNVAPYAKARASSENRADDQYQPFDPSRVNDRRGFIPLPSGGPPNPVARNDSLNAPRGGLLQVLRDGKFVEAPKSNEPEQVTADDPNLQDNETGWMSIEHDADASAAGEWIQLKWKRPVKIKTIRLIGAPPTGGDWGGFGSGPTTTPYHITSGTLQLWLGKNKVGPPIAVGQVEAYADGGTLITLAEPVTVNKLRFVIHSVDGYWYWSRVAALNEIEVMGMAGNAAP
ncbi:MAG: hypothetical protein B6D41_18055 [Chloroflexi bacterium UTCFX4]|nr:MAG: hypothetical protein B6D41_18055 [Chloroflexi bacterium UTCFX4]